MSPLPPTVHRRSLLAAGAGALALSVSTAGCLATLDDDDAETDAEPETSPALTVASATQYSNPGCACCEGYASYLEGHLETDLSVTVPDEIDEIKRERGVPDELRSCHTVDLDGYVVEGHVPVEAIATLLAEEPAIDGIALPGMPAGSPGMSGEKSGPFAVYAFGGDGDGDGGEYDVFVEL